MERMRVSVVLMTYAERDSIRGVIDGFFATGVVDEVLVVNNNAQPGTSEEVARTARREVFEPLRATATPHGEGWRRPRAICTAGRARRHVPAADILKMLSYSGECEAVLGTRTTRELIWSDANMGWFLSWGNWAVAKLVEVIFNTSHISDIGCTYGCSTGRMADYVADNDADRREPRRGRDPDARPALGGRFVEIPVNYLPRVGSHRSPGIR